MGKRKSAYSKDEVFALYFSELETYRAGDPLRVYLKNMWDLPLRKLIELMERTNMPEEIRDETVAMYRQMQTDEAVTAITEAATTLFAADVMERMRVLRNKISEVA